MEGTPFGRYRLIELLGRGGMGEVWRAYDTVTDRVVALKLLPENLADNEVFQQRFRREARAAAGLDEPHVVPIHDFGEIEGRLFVTMRLIKGHDLQTLLAGGPMPLPRAVVIVEQVASALHAAHKVGLVHRDVKPSNILVAEDDFAYLIDFGIARTAEESRLTTAGSVVGTWAYMAPERITKGEADPRSDVYALACVLHECVTGEIPFPGDSLEQQIAAHLSMPPPRPSTLSGAVPHQFDEVIATGMAKNPAQRYANTKQLAKAARAATTAPIPRPPSTPPPSHPQMPAAYLQQPPPRRAPYAAQQPVMGDAVSPAAATEPSSRGGSGQSPQTPLRRPAAAIPPPAAPRPVGKRRRRAFILGALAGIVGVIAVVTALIVTQQRDTGRPSASSQRPTSSRSVAPVTAAQLDGLLLDVAAIDTEMHTPMKVVGTLSKNLMWTDQDRIPDKNCLAVYFAAEREVYAGTAWADVRGQALRNSGTTLAYARQAVVSFEPANAAAAFYAASSQSWSACSNRQFTFTDDNGEKMVWSAGAMSDQNGMLTISSTLLDTPVPLILQRALTVRNNVVIDTVAQSVSPSSQIAVAIAEQIAKKVPE